jgi:hypothetical protein
MAEFNALQKRKEIEAAQLKAEGEVRLRQNEKMINAIKEAVPHPEYSAIWDTYHDTRFIWGDKRPEYMENGNIPGAKQQAIECDLHDKYYIYDTTELYNKMGSLNILGEKQRIKSPERVKLEGELQQYVVQEWYSKKLPGDYFGEYGSAYKPAIEIAGYKARTREEGEAIVEVLVLHELMSSKKKDDPDLQKIVVEYAKAAQELNKIQAGLPKYTPLDKVINTLISYKRAETSDVDEVTLRNTYRNALKNNTLEQIEGGIKEYARKFKNNTIPLVEAAAAEVKVAGDSAAAAAAAGGQKPKGIFGGLFGRSRKSRSRNMRTRKHRKN